MPGQQLVAVFALGLMVLVVGCGSNEVASSDMEITDEQLIPQIPTWVNAIGLAQDDMEAATTAGVS